MACLKGIFRKLYSSFPLLLSLSWHTATYAQEAFKLNFSAKHLEGGVINGEPCKKLIGDAVIVLDKLTIQADHAIYYSNTRLIEAQGAVKIVHEDGAVITADQLFYEEDNQLAKLRYHVVYKSGATTFYTDYFDYNMASKQGYFAHGGKLIEADNVLTSESGQYNDLDKSATFYKNVVLVNKEYTLQCDTLHYNTITKIAQFEGFTKIISKDGKQTLTTHEGGEYDTGSQQSTFTQSKVETKAYTLYGDLLRADQAAQVYTATGHVRLVAKEDDIIISGDHGQYQKKEGIAKVHGNTLMTKLLEQDALYLSADTFVATENKSAQEGTNHTTLHAYHNVKVYQENFQGKADTMRYQSADSTIYFYGDPIFWSNTSQLTADSVHVLFQDKSLHAMHMDTHAFIVSEDAVGNYNQLSGKSMVAFFKQNKIDCIEIDGNAESLYFLLEDDGQVKGMNHLRCSHVRINIEESTIADITFRRKPMGTFYPLQEIVEKHKKLDGFHWRIDERPTRREVVEHGYGTRGPYKQFKLD
ncbi:MAG: OstA-like protein [Bacteroidota bacterium]